MSNIKFELSFGCLLEEIIEIALYNYNEHGTIGSPLE
jgi:hypothetical protein